MVWWEHLLVTGVRMCVALAEIACVSTSDSASSATPSTGVGGREQKEGEIFSSDRYR